MQSSFQSPHDDRDLGEMAEEANWPVGHLALGEQLREDANFLADRYPAGAPPALLMALAQVLEEEPADAKADSTSPTTSPEVAAPAKSIGWAGIVPAVLAGIALAAVAVIVVPQWLPQDNVAQPNKSAPNGAEVATLPAASPIDQAPDAVTPTTIENSNPMTPALFEELSGPEREGLLDLLEHQPNEKPRLSI